MRLTFKCGNCGQKAKMPDDSKLILVHGPTDGTGLQHKFLYCRRCKMVTDFVGAGCLSLLIGRLLQAEGVYDPLDIFDNYPEFSGIFAPKIRQAMEEDGVVNLKNGE